MSRTFTLPQIIAPANADPDLLSVVQQFNNRMRMVEAEFALLCQDVYVRSNDRPYFLPTNGAVPGYKLVYATRSDEAGRVLPSAEWVP